MRFVCPKLDAWVELYEKIDGLLKKLDVPDIPPPTPLTFDEWSSFTDDEKEEQWMLFFGWLETRQLEFLADFADEEWYVTGVQYIDNGGSSSLPPYGKDPLF
jgi:hypothetical protein